MEMLYGIRMVTVLSGDDFSMLADPPLAANVHSISAHTTGKHFCSKACFIYTAYWILEADKVLNKSSFCMHGRSPWLVGDYKPALFTK